MKGNRTSLLHGLVVAGLLLGLSACDQHEDKPATPASEPTHMNPPTIPSSQATPSPSPQQTATDSQLFLRFLATGESFYTEIKLENGVLSYTYFEDTTKRCGQWVQSRPCWTEDDLKTVSVKLSEKEIDKLYAAIGDSGILDIDETKLGGAQKGQRFYAQHLEIHAGSIEKHLIYQSFPGASKKPEAFQRLEDILHKYAHDLPR